MYNITAKNANDFYEQGIQLLKDKGKKLQIRGSEVIELIGVNIEILNPRDRVITEVNRKFPLKGAMAEFLWYMTKNNKVEIITPFLKHWINFSDNGLYVNSNYGYQWRSQIPEIIEKIKRDRYTRQAVICLYDKEYSHYYGKDTVCTPTFQLFIRDDRLHMIVNSRSRDIVRGECIDQFTFSCLQELIANELGIELGTYQNCIGSLHIYSDHYDLLDNEIKFTENEYKDLKINMNYTDFWKTIENEDETDFIKTVIKSKEIDISHFKKYV
jgi:thymidylate synthase